LKKVEKKTALKQLQYTELCEILVHDYVTSTWGLKVAKLFTDAKSFSQRTVV